MGARQKRRRKTAALEEQNIDVEVVRTTTSPTQH
jgi:hypothetical protein